MSKKIVIPIITILTVAVFAMGLMLINEDEGINKLPVDQNTQFAQEVSEDFITGLFSANEDVLELCTGTVKRNIEKGMDSLPVYKVNEIITVPEFVSSDFATINTIVEYQREDESVDIEFYRFSLINENGDFLVYNLENNVAYGSNNTVDNIEVSNSGLIDAVDLYFKDISSGNLSGSATHLVGRARADHIRSYEFVSQAFTTMDIEFNDIEHSIVSNDMDRLAIVRSDYASGNSDISILSTLFKTSKGWKIYEIKQI